MLKNGYNLMEVREAMQKVEKFNVTVEKKQDHKAFKVWDLKNLYIELMSVNRFLFNTDNQYDFRRYKEAVELGETKKELDHLLKLCIKYLNKELYLIEKECC